MDQSVSKQKYETQRDGSVFERINFPWPSEQDIYRESVVYLPPSDHDRYACMQNAKLHQTVALGSPSYLSSHSISPLPLLFSLFPSFFFFSSFFCRFAVHYHVT